MKSLILNQVSKINICQPAKYKGIQPEYPHSCNGIIITKNTKRLQVILRCQVNKTGIDVGSLINGENLYISNELKIKMRLV